MRIITGNRGSGKTAELVKEANTLVVQGHKVIILIAHKSFKDIFKNYGLNNKVQILTFTEYQRNSIGNDSYKNADILIDQIDIFLEAILNNNIASITANKEDMFEVKKKSVVKKKIKDLTLEEELAFCERHRAAYPCEACPLMNQGFCPLYGFMFVSLIERDGEKEIEIDE